jgi:phosphoglycerol transferase
MTSPAFERPDGIYRNTSEVVLCVVLLFFVFFVLRAVGLEPTVFADEWLHSMNSRLLPLNQVSDPSFLYYFIYKATDACGLAFLECARFINIIVFVAASLAFFLYARLHVPIAYALAFLMIFLGCPNNVYLFVFSPDALFHSAFVIFFISLLLFDNATRAVISGLLLGLLALIKIHALFLLIGTILFLLIEHGIHRRRVFEFFTNSVLTVLSLTASKAVIGFLLAGRAGLSITGNRYSGIASSALDLPTVMGRLSLFAFSTAGYCAAILILIGTPLLSYLFMKSRSDQRGAALDRILATAAPCVLLPLLVIIAMFAALTSDSGPYESIRRLSLRYCSFILPFFYLLGASALIKVNYGDLVSARTRAATLILGAVLLVMIFVISNYYQPNTSDSPEIVFLTQSRASLVVGSVLVLLPLVLVFVRPSLVAPGYVTSLLLMVFVGNYVCLRELQLLRVPTPFDAAGRHAALFLGSERANVAVFGTEPAGLYRALFHLNAVGPIIVQVRSGMQSEELTRQLQGRKWALLVGPDALKLAPPNTPAPAGFVLIPAGALTR